MRVRRVRNVVVSQAVAEVVHTRRTLLLPGTMVMLAMMTRGTLTRGTLPWQLASRPS